MGTLFQNSSNHLPLAEKLRPATLDDFVGQEHILGEKGILRRIIESDRFIPMIFWGPPGCGKTTLARIIARRTNSNFVFFSAVSNGVGDARKIIDKARDDLELYQKRTILFVDEIHRFNKSQQDYFLPFVENGTVILLGATTENPSFEVNAPLLSRARVFHFRELTIDNISALIDRATRTINSDFEKYFPSLINSVIARTQPFQESPKRLETKQSPLSVIPDLDPEDLSERLPRSHQPAAHNGDKVKVDKTIEQFNNLTISITKDAKHFIAQISEGDVRDAYNALELAIISADIVKGKIKIDKKLAEESVQQKFIRYDKGADGHYDAVSALHKSIRASDTDAALHYLARMLEAGEEPLYVVRRLVRCASEDIGLADPQALILAVAVQQTVHFLGTPECNDAIAELVIYLSLAKKSRAVDNAYNEARNDVLNTRLDPIPLVIRNAETKMMKDFGYGKGYEMYSKDSHLPENIKNKKYWKNDSINTVSIKI